MPFYVEGPYDDAHQIMQTLDASVGPGNYRFLRSVPLPSEPSCCGTTPFPTGRQGASAR